MQTLGISLIAHNEEKQIANAIESAMFADDIVLINCESTDKTVEIAQKFPKVRIFDRANNKNLNLNKSFGFEQLTTDWIFYLDPDEVITPQLAAEIRQIINSDSECCAYKLPRKNFFFERWLSHGGQYPDTQLRLFKRGKAAFPNKHVHEMLKVEGKTGRLKEAFEHHPYPYVEDYVRKMNFYTTFQANFWIEQNLSPSIFNTLKFMFFKPYFRFLRRYLLKAGFKNGWQGFVAAIGDSFQHAVSYAKFLEMVRDKK